MVAEEGKKEGEGFTVVDKRKAFHEEPDSGQQSHFAGEAKDAAPAESNSTSGAADTSTSRERERVEARPPPDFSTFVLSIAFTAQLHLGLVPNPDSGKVSADLVAAKQTIDMIGMLQEKTKGNLTAEESQLLKNTLNELRMGFVQIAESAAGGPQS